MKFCGNLSRTALISFASGKECTSMCHNKKMGRQKRKSHMFLWMDLGERGGTAQFVFVDYVIRSIWNI